MRFTLVEPINSLEKSLRNKDVSKELPLFKEAKQKYLDQFEQAQIKNEREEHYKKLLNDFLQSVYGYEMNTLGNTDSVIYNANHEAMVMIEMKRYSNVKEMITDGDVNRKAFHELLRYYICYKDELFSLNHLMITDGQLTYFFHKKDIDQLLKEHENIANYIQKYRHNTDVVYDYIKNVLVKSSFHLSAVKCDMRCDDDELLYKLHSRYYLFRERLNKDANSLNQKFYAELLHILGLKDTTGLRI